MAADPLTRAAAEADDAADPLAAFRDRFVSDATGVIYLDGSSLGRLPVATRERLGAAAAEWGERLVGGWHDWIDAPVRTGDLLAEQVLGAGPGEVVVCDSTTVNLFKLVGAVLDAPDTPRHPPALVAGVVPDFRGPDAVRLGVAPLYIRHVDVWDALDRLRDLVARREHEEFDPSPGRVT